MDDEDYLLPDFAGVESFEDVQSRFIIAARRIMFQYELKYGSQTFEISSLELYLKLHQQKEIWCDPATDGDDEQFNRATWYVRRKKGPAYWRLDITAGRRDSGIQAGLLIRAVDKNDGPAKALHTIVRGSFNKHRWKVDERKRLDEIHGKSIREDSDSPMKLVRRTESIQGPYFIGIRKNIPLRHGEQSRLAPLRIATWRMTPHDVERGE